MKKVFVFAGGGSGGHIYPGLAIAEELRRLSQEAGREVHVVFVCSNRPLDATILTSAGEQHVPSPAQPLHARPSGVWKFVLGWRKARRQAAGLLGDLRSRADVRGEPHVVAMGGFVAGPVVAAARSMGYSSTLVNLDAVPGKANRWLSKRVDRVFTAARVRPGVRGSGSWVEVPPIVRAGARAAMSAEECKRRMGIDPGKRVLVVTGGSQGLRSLNDFVVACASSAEGRHALVEGGWVIVHQTGRKFEEPVREAYARAGVDARVHAFSTEMGVWWGGADAVVCTAGAGTVAEVWLNRVPALLMPYPHHKDRHQTFNARPLVDSGGAELGEDLIEPEANVARNGPSLVRMLADPSRREAMRAGLSGLGPADGATRIARALLDG